MCTFVRSVFSRLGAPSAAALVAVVSSMAAPVMAADSSYIPTMKDMMSIQGAMHRYHEGLDQHDDKLMASAFAEDGTLALIDHGKQISNVHRDQIATGGLLGGGPPPGGLPAVAPDAQSGHDGPGGPPEGFPSGAPGAPPGGPSGPPPAVAEGAAPPAGGAPSGGDPSNLWHFTEIDSYFKFESPTRATHYAYWMDVHVHEESRSATLGIPGHYEDVFVKRKGEWLFLSRKIFVGTK